MTAPVLYSRSVSAAGRVRYDPVGCESGTMKPGIWLVRDTVGGHSESWIAPICDVPTAIHAACLATFRDRLAAAIAAMAQQKKTYSVMELAELCLDKLREMCPPVEVAGKTTKFYVCAGCGRPIDGAKMHFCRITSKECAEKIAGAFGSLVPPLVVDMKTGRCITPGVFGAGTAVYAADTEAQPENAPQGTAKAVSAGRGPIPVPKGGKRPKCAEGGKECPVERLVCKHGWTADLCPLCQVTTDEVVGKAGEVVP